MWLWKCSPLASWISVSQCQSNAKRCAKALKAQLGSEKRMAAIHLQHACPGCQGVEARSALEGHSPRLVPGSHRPMPKANGKRFHKISHTKASRWVTAEFLAARFPFAVNEIHERLKGSVRPVSRKGTIWYLRGAAERELSGAVLRPEPLN